MLDARVADLPAADRRLQGGQRDGASAGSSAAGSSEIGKDGRLRVARLTPAGEQRRGPPRRKRLAKHRGARSATTELLAALEPIMAFRPEPSGWRAGARQPQTLPHFPLVLHRGGYPDGA